MERIQKHTLVCRHHFPGFSLFHPVVYGRTEIEAIDYHFERFSKSRIKIFAKFTTAEELISSLKIPA